MLTHSETLCDRKGKNGIELQQPNEKRHFFCLFLHSKCEWEQWRCCHCCRLEMNALWLLLLCALCTVHIIAAMNVKRDGLQCVGYEMHIVLEQIMVKGVKPSSLQWTRATRKKKCMKLKWKYTHVLHCIKFSPLTNRIYFFFVSILPFRSLRFNCQTIFPNENNNNRKWSPFTFDKMAFYHNCRCKANGTFC